MAEKYINDFDSKAVEWDKNSMHWDSSEAIVNEIKKFEVFLLIAKHV